MKQLFSGARRRFAVELLRFTIRTNPAHDSLNGAELLRRLSTRPTVLFVCLGNVCRSPMAERYLRKCAREADIGPFDVRSAGLIETEGRPSPPRAIRTARRYGVDLSDHRSTLLTEKLLTWADVVFVMDVRNYHSLLRKYEAVDHVHFLRPAGDGKLEIRDPCAKDTETIRDVYRQIVSACEGLLEQFETREEDLER